MDSLREAKLEAIEHYLDNSMIVFATQERIKVHARLILEAIEDTELEEQMEYLRVEKEREFAS